jgi:hypothetical protein
MEKDERIRLSVKELCATLWSWDFILGQQRQKIASLGIMRLRPQFIMNTEQHLSCILELAGYLEIYRSDFIESY